MGVTVLINVTLNIVLILKFDYVGAAMASLISTITLFILGMYWVPKIINYNKWYLVKNFVKILIASLIMGGTIYYLLNNILISWWWLIPAGAVVYLVALWILRGISKQDVIDVYESVIKD